MSDRQRISNPARRFIIGQSGGRCNKCRAEVFVQNEFGEKARLGDDAHIVASSDFGPRGNEEVGQQQRRSSDNLILLCKNCHSEIDQQPQKFTEELLLQMRDAHYRWVEERLGSARIEKPPFHYLSYINIPRADMYASLQSIALPSFDLTGAETIRQLGMNAGRLMAQYTAVLNVEELYTNLLTDATALPDVNDGDYWFTNGELFRTKRIGGLEDLPAAWLNEESVIYRDFGSWRLICLIDPRWITTTTALVEFQRGSYRLAGLLHVKRVDVEKRRVIASPLFLGSPDRSASR